MVDIRQTALPGMGLRHEFETQTGHTLGVITHRTGHFELFVYESDDPDTPSAVVELTPEERRSLIEVLGGSRIVEQLAQLQQEVEGLAIDWIPMPDRSPYAGRPLGETQARTRTGVSIVAVLRSGHAVPAPGPERELLPGDTLVIVGTPAGIQRFGELLHTG